LQADEHQKGFLAPNYAGLAEAYLELADGDSDEPFTMLAIAMKVKGRPCHDLLYTER